jgi:hypothetical protein
MIQIYSYFMEVRDESRNTIQIKTKKSGGTGFGCFAFAGEWHSYSFFLMV